MSTFVEGLRETLALELEAVASWRMEKAASHPDDSRNERTGHALREWAGDVRRLPDDDPAFAPFVALADDRGESDPYILGVGSCRALVARVSFQGGPVTLDELLAQMAAMMKQTYEDLDLEILDGDLSDLDDLADRLDEENDAK